jgi:hypothetical protein
MACVIGGKHHGDGQAQSAFNWLPLDQGFQDVLSVHAGHLFF